MASNANNPAPRDRNNCHRGGLYVANPVVKMASTATIHVECHIELRGSSLMPAILPANFGDGHGGSVPVLCWWFSVPLLFGIWNASLARRIVDREIPCRSSWIFWVSGFDLRLGRSVKRQLHRAMIVW